MQFPFVPVTDFEDITQNFEFAQSYGLFLDKNGIGSVVQLVTAGKVAMDHGTGTWTWPGSNMTSNLVTISHGLARTPFAVSITPNQDQGSVAGTLLGWSVSNKTTTQFSSRAGFQTFTPGAGVTATFDWVAYG